MNFHVRLAEGEPLENVGVTSSSPKQSPNVCVWPLILILVEPYFCMLTVVSVLDVTIGLFVGFLSLNLVCPQFFLGCSSQVQMDLTDSSSDVHQKHPVQLYN